MSPAAQRTGPPDGTKASRRFIKTAFTLMGVGALAATLFAAAQARLLESNVRYLVYDMLSGIRLVSQLDDDLDKRRNLVNHHITLTDPTEMRRADAELGAVQARIASEIRGYEAWIDLPGERDAWDRTRADVGALDAPIARALALSRRNRNAEARLIVDQTAPQFDAVNDDFDRVIAINARGAADTLAGSSIIRQRLVVTLLGIGLVGAVATLVFGRWALTQITRREEEMILAAQKLEARNHELDAFAGRVAHDIRGALTSITLAMTPLSTRVPPDDRAMQILSRGTRRMEALVEDLLALSRVEAFVHGRCDPVNVVTWVVQELGPRIEAERGALRVSVEHAEVACSEGLLRQAVTNLVDNAVKYRRPELAPEIVISGRPGGGGYDLRVSDNGVGLSKEEVVQIARPFYRSPRTHDRPGTGLGLSIVSRVAEASRGTLSVDSRLGQGSTFVVHLPLAAGPVGERSAPSDQ